MRKITVPIYLKLVFFTLLILGASLSAYVYYAVNLFQNDKISYVYEAVDDYNEKITEQYTNKQLSVLKSLIQIETLNYDSEFVFNYLRQNPDIDSYFEFNSTGISKIVTLEGANKDSYINESFEKLKASTESLLVIENKLFIISKIGKSKKSIAVVAKLNNFLLKPESSLYTTQFLYWNNPKNNLELKIKEYLNSKEQVSQTFLVSDIEDYIVSARKLAKGIFVISSTDYAKALSASATLKSNSIYFGLLVAGIVMILVLIFSQIVTGPINKLAKLVNEFLSSNFQVRSEVKTSDEIGFLASSFNKMADDINAYIVEMEHKAKIEQELQTANIVQSQFFPQSVFKNSHCQVSGFYQSASECGGDWWGVFETKDTTVVILADVTGHGTPAALMTAVLHSSLNSLEYLSKLDEQFSKSSGKIMGFLNDSFFKSTNKLNATAFVMCLNHQTSTVNYSNASHNPPYYLELGGGKTLDKAGVRPLLEKIGPRLGEKKDVKYDEVLLSIAPRDKIILYTDGILEGVNADKKVYGQRKFIKEILRLQNGSVQDFSDGIMKSFFDFSGDEPLEDDITFVCFEIVGQPEFWSSNISEGELGLITDVLITNNRHGANILYDQALIENLRNIPARIEKLIPLEHYKQFGISKVEVNGNKIATLKFLNESASEVIDQISIALEGIKSDGSFSDLSHYLLTVSSELVRNGIILNLSQDSEKEQKEVFLDIDEGEENIFVKVTDQFGRLKSEDITRRLKEVAMSGTYERKAYGAGLGLFMVINSVNTIEFNVTPGIQTEVICRINKYKRLKQFKEKQTAIFFNIKE
ncbi:MAG: sigma-B regulation protein RsbU (phosphoserine phosphatase) [Bacteriovoracaceae bacterium]|jgi:sigma-B regulation protein RsbU (phosphoserine phosphatase)